ncbi:MAG: nucleotide exchange factor GrpE [Desulfotomaculaceae bacterium]
MQDKQGPLAQSDINTLHQALEEEKNRHLRTLADFDNYRKRVERQAQSYADRGKKELAAEMLPILDNLERALAQLADERTHRGLVIVYRQFIDVFKKHGLEQLESLGLPFNPEEHEGIGYVSGTKYSPGHVAEEMRRGYRFGKELLRPATVRVAAR